MKRLLAGTDTRDPSLEPDAFIHLLQLLSYLHVYCTAEPYSISMRRLQDSMPMCTALNVTVFQVRVSALMGACEARPANDLAPDETRRGLGPL